jgi:hypothetical protein
MARRMFTSLLLIISWLAVPPHASSAKLITVAALSPDPTPYLSTFSCLRGSGLPITVGRFPNAGSFQRMLQGGS